MIVDLTNETDELYDFESQNLEVICEEVLKKLELKKPSATVEVFLVSNDKIQSLNEKYRQKDCPTDVLSFPQESFPGAKEQVLGTIFISPEFAKTEAISLENLFRHGFLHLLGYDHETNIKEWEMAEEKTDQKTL